jgi:hypothetical protein
LVLAVIGLLAFWKFHRNEPEFTNQNNQNRDVKTGTPPAVIYSFNGTVQSISGSTYTLTLPDGSSNSFITATSTVILKQSQNKQVPANISDIKIGSQVVVYTKSDPSYNKSAAAYSVQIIK